MRRAVALFLFPAYLGVACAQPAAAAECAPRREAASLQLATFTSGAELMLPPAGSPVLGSAVLIQGSDIADRDGTIIGAGGKILSRPMRQVAEALACAGVASLRYDKRYVTGATTLVDAEKFGRLTGQDLADDGRTAAAWLRARPDLATLPVAVVGWSEGSTVAAELARTDPAIRALVVIAPVVAPHAAVVQAQYGRIGKPYLARYASGDRLDAAALEAAARGPGGVLAQIFVRMFTGFRPGERINPLLDADKDGAITFAEADPVIAAWYADRPGGGLGMATTGRALPGLAAVLPAISVPVLALQGRADGMIGPDALEALAAADGRLELREYDGLGHALGPSSSPLEDGLTPTAEPPLRDLAQWLAAQLRAASRRASSGRIAQDKGGR